MIFCTILMAFHTLNAQDMEFVQFTKSEINLPVEVANAGDDRMFVVEQTGRIHVVQNDGTVSSTPFLDIKSRVPFEGSQHGLLGLAFHPNYATNGKFYVNYIAANRMTTISEFSVSSNANIADPNSEVKLLEFEQPAKSFADDHKGGCIKFGPDGYLYIASGDGGKGTNGANAQNLTKYMGKILRIKVTGNGTMSFPSDNPFIDNPNALNGIWAYGSRNPWKLSFDRKNGDLYIGDVGADRWDEIHYQKAGSPGGVNYGWPCFEGIEVWEDLPSAVGCPAMDATSLPILTFYQSAPAIKVSIVGGFVYRGTKTPFFDGHYIYAESYTGEVIYAHKEGDDWVKETFGNKGLFLTAFGEDAEGELYGLAMKIPGLADAGNHLYKIKLIEPEVIIPPLANQSSDKISEIKIYPNPATGYVTIEGIALDNNVKVYDLSGNLIDSKQSLSTEGNLLISGLDAGVYLLKFTDRHSNNRQVRKIIVH
jgi:glucose/arabinose dehydrogenase